MNQLSKRLRQGEVILGLMVVQLFTSGIGPMLAASGMDFVLYDMEHGRCDINLLAEMAASCRGRDIGPLVRVPDQTSRPLSRVLDIGVRGVMVPRVETRARAEEIVSQLKYAPLGRRGVAVGMAHVFTNLAELNSLPQRTKRRLSFFFWRRQRPSRTSTRFWPFRESISRGWGTTI